MLFEDYILIPYWYKLSIGFPVVCHLYPGKGVQRQQMEQGRNCIFICPLKRNIILDK